LVPEYQNLRLELSEGIAFLTLDRARGMNVLNLETLAELGEVLVQLQEDREVKVVVIRGAGDRAFSAGADIKELDRLDAASGAAFSSRGQAVFDQIENGSKAVIASIRGYCLGGGCELALACHLRVASEDARFGLPEVKLGLIPGYGGTQRLPRVLGSGRALEMLLCGDQIDAAEAHRVGLVNHVVAAADLDPFCRRLAARIGVNAPLAVRYAIEAVNRGMEMSLQAGLSLESALFGTACASEDMKEGVQAFVEKRAARFEGQ
jgi:enoyl-CoA hydratase